MTINERIVRHFAALYKNGGRNGRSASFNTMSSFVKPLGALGLTFGKTDEAEITKDEFDLFYTKLTDDKSINTCHKYRSLLAQFFAFASEERDEHDLPPLKLIERYLVRYHRSLEKAVPAPYYTEDAFIERCQGLKPKYLLIAQIAYYAGLRVSEVLHLKGEDVREDGLIIRKKGGTTKSGNREEIAWCSPWLIGRIKEYRASEHLQLHQFIFTSAYKKGPICSVRVNQSFKGRFKPHELRALFAATLALGNVKLEIVRQRLRHNSLDMTALYIRKFNVDMMHMEEIKDETLWRLGVLPAHLIRPMSAPEAITPQEAVSEAITEELQEVAG